MSLRFSVCDSQARLCLKKQMQSVRSTAFRRHPAQLPAKAGTTNNSQVCFETKPDTLESVRQFDFEQSILND